jgi:hypothetical protein
MKALVASLAIVMTLGLATVGYSADADKKYTEGSCCAKAAAKGEKCKHPCCVKAEAEGKVCKKCNKDAK